MLGKFTFGEKKEGLDAEFLSCRTVIHCTSRVTPRAFTVDKELTTVSSEGSRHGSPVRLCCIHCTIGGNIIVVVIWNTDVGTFPRVFLMLRGSVTTLATIVALLVMRIIMLSIIIGIWIVIVKVKSCHRRSRVRTIWAVGRRYCMLLSRCKHLPALV